MSAAITVRHLPMSAAAPRRRVDGEGPTDFVGPMSQIGQPAAGDLTDDSRAVVDDVDSQFVLDEDVDVQGGGSGMPDGIADRFADNGFGMVGEGHVDDGKRAGILHIRSHLGTGELIDRLIEPLPQPRAAGLATVQVEDRGADLLDHVL